MLWATVAPWRDLGGLVDERLRWLAAALVCTGLPIGLTIGGIARDAAERDGRRTHARLARAILYPVLVSGAAVGVALRVAGAPDGASAAVAGVLAYWAGLDLAFAAFPLMAGKPYRFVRALDALPVARERPAGRR